jgi:hypothetical protein
MEISIERKEIEKLPGFGADERESALVKNEPVETGPLIFAERLNGALYVARPAVAVSSLPDAAGFV